MSSAQRILSYRAFESDAENAILAASQIVACGYIPGIYGREGVASLHVYFPGLFITSGKMRPVDP